MNNMLEYMTGGQCYECGGKVRYADGGENMQQQSPVANMGAQQPKRQPTTIDANAKELMRFLLAQLEKGTSERILKKTLTDNGLKSQQAEELLAIAKQEFDKTIAEGDYSTSEQERQIQMQAQQQQMAMMNQTGPGAKMDPAMMEMSQQPNESQTAESMEARFGGSLRRLRRMNMGGTCPDGLVWNEATGSCMPSSATANLISAGSGPVNLGGANPQTAQQQIQQVNTVNQNAITQAQTQDQQRNAQINYFSGLENAYAKNKQTKYDAKQGAIGALHQSMLNGELPWQAPKGTIATPSTDPVQELGRVAESGYRQSQTVAQRFGGLIPFLSDRKKKYGAGGTEDGCPEGYYKDNNGDCQKIFGSGQARQEYQKQVVDFYNQAGAPSVGANKGAMMSFEEWQQTGEGKAQDDMYNEMISSPKAFQKYVNDYSTANAGKAGAAPQLTYEDWKAQQLGQPSNNTATNASGTTAVDPRTTNSPYIVRTDKNKLANLDNNWVNRALAVGSNLGSAETLGATGAFGPYLQMLLGATGAASSAILGAKKFLAKDKQTVYDDKGNVFQSGQNTQGSSPNIPNTGVNEDIPKDHYLKTGTDKHGNNVGISREGELLSHDHPMRNQVINKGTAAERTYTDNMRLDENLFLAGKTKKDFREQGPALFGANAYGSQQELADDYKNAGFFGKMRQRNQFKKDQLWNVPQDQEQLLRNMNPDAFPQDNSTGNAGPPQQSPVINNAGPVANDADAQNKLNYLQSQLKVQREGGEWNPFVDNRRKLRISMPMYGGGGPINGETTPYTQQEWAQVQSKTFPLKPEDIQPYNDYVASFNNASPQNNTNTQTNLTTPQVNMNNNANNALSANPNTNMVDTKEITIERGEGASSQLSNNLYSGLAGFNAAREEVLGRRRMNEIGKIRQGMGNSMEVAAVNPINMYGSWQPNANQGSNYDLANQGHTQDWQTTLNAKFGGSIYRRGGTYMVSPQELQAIIAMGGEVEFLD